MATLSLRIQVRHWRLLIWAGTIGLAAVAGWNLWQIFKRYRANAYEPRSSTYFEQKIGNVSGSIDQGEVKLPDFNQEYRHALVDCPINGYVKPEEKPAEETKVEEGPPPKKPITDVITVNAIICAPDDLGRVVVKYKDDTVKPFSRDETVLKVGASLAQPYDAAPFSSKLKSVHADSAIFEWCGADVEIHPARKEEAATKEVAKPGDKTKPFDSTLTAAERELLEKNKNQEKTIALPNDAGYIVGTKDAADFSANGDAYLKDAQITDRKDANGKKEVVVGSLRPNSYIAKTYGVQAGDSLVSINGTPITSRTQAYQYVRENNTLEKYVVVIRRKGRDVTKTIFVNRSGK